MGLRKSYKEPKISNGYRLVFCPRNHRADDRGFVLEHVLVVEGAIGFDLDPKHDIHHVDENRLNNRNNNLVVCEDRAYHKLLHWRRRVITLGGDPNTDSICAACKVPKPKTEFRVNNSSCSGSYSYCRDCDKYVERQRRKKLTRLSLV